MAKEQVRGNTDCRKGWAGMDPVCSIYDIASALKFLSAKFDDDDHHAGACILSVLSEHLRSVGEKMDEEEWQPAKEAI